MEISALANEELLAVLRFLTPEDLLQCRAVCHRWASLAQDPTVWSGQKVETEKCNPKLVTAILRFAPCLGHLQVNSRLKIPDPLWGTLLSTACAIFGLEFVSTSADTVYVALIISRNASLGRLKALAVDVVDKPGTPISPAAKHSLCGLLMQISYTQGLGEIFCSVDNQLMAGAVAEFAKRVGCATQTAPVSPSLTCMTIHDFDSFGQLLLQWHADTLEYVYASAPSPNSPEAAPLLSRLPRLHTLACAPLDNMDTLLQCPSLKKVELFVARPQDSADERRLSKACAYLRVAVSTQVEHLTLSPDAGASHSVKKLLLCLEGQEGTAVALECLILVVPGTSMQRAGRRSARYQQQLVEVLHRLSLLYILDLDSMPVPALLQALDGRVLPELALLLVRLPVGESSADCGHQFIHSETVRTLLRNYPELHIVVKEVEFPDGCGCAFCKEGCHAVPDEAWCMLFGHEAGAACDVPHEYCVERGETKDCIAFHVATD